MHYPDKHAWPVDSTHTVHDVRRSTACTTWRDRQHLRRALHWSIGPCGDVEERAGVVETGVHKVWENIKIVNMYNCALAMVRWG